VLHTSSSCQASNLRDQSPRTSCNRALRGELRTL